jgi:hypothetical protein
MKDYQVKTLMEVFKEKEESEKKHSEIMNSGIDGYEIHNKLKDHEYINIHINYTRRGAMTFHPWVSKYIIDLDQEDIQYFKNKYSNNL